VKTSIQLFAVPFAVTYAFRVMKVYIMDVALKILLISMIRSF
jgi:hypothetical protein